MTNIRDETRQRRTYTLSLYIRLRKLALTLTELLDQKENRKQLALETVLCQFLVWGKKIKVFVFYPEPIDRRNWVNTTQAIDHTWVTLSQLATWHASHRASAISRIDSLANALRPLFNKKYSVTQYQPPVQISDNFETVKNDEEYQKTIAPLIPWLELYEKSEQPQVIKEFYASLIQGPQSLNPTLGAAIESIQSLI